MQETENVIRIGTSPMTPAQLLMQQWPKMQARCPDIKFQIVPFENTPENAWEILGNLGRNIDVAGGIFDDTMLDQLRDDIWQNHHKVNIVDFEFCNMNVFNRCENSNDVLLAIPGWANVPPLLKVIPVEWEHSIPYGILHSPKPSETVSRFLAAARAAATETAGKIK